MGRKFFFLKRQYSKQKTAWLVSRSEVTIYQNSPAIETGQKTRGDEIRVIHLVKYIEVEDIKNLIKANLYTENPLEKMGKKKPE